MATRISAVTVPKLEDQAANAALYAPKTDSNDGNRFLDSDNKLSSASAATSLKYANPKDLPSFPSVGLKKDDTADGRAATLAWQNQKPVELWTPDPSASASKAAMLAKDYKAPPIWRPEESSNGAKAALLAAKDHHKVEIWKPEATQWGNSAANLAFKKDLSPQLDYGYTAVGRQGSLLAATGAMSGTRKRSDSTPVSRPTYPDEANADRNALSAATHANNPSRKTRTEHSSAAGASPFTNMPKEMFTSHPPVAPEVDEKRRSDILHASAVAMAKQMYKLQQKQIEQTKAQRSEGQSAAMSAHGRKLSTSSDDEPTPMRFNNLQEAAERLAQERLAKLHDEHAQNREYRNYYGDHSLDTRPTSRLSIRGRMRRRASSDGSLDEDREQSQKIRAQMSIFTNNLTQVDAKKRQQDREALMAIAKRNVAAKLHNMDEKGYKGNGRAPVKDKEWNVKAQAAAKKNSDSRMENYGKIDIGGGVFVDQSVVNDAARRNVQPVLDEINAEAERKQAREADLKFERDAEARKAENEKAREKEMKEINRRLKEQDKEEERARKEREKEMKAEEKRRAKESKRKSKEYAPAKKDVGSPPAETAAEPVADRTSEHTVERTVEPVVVHEQAETEHVPETRTSPVVEEPRHVASTTSPGYVAPSGMRTSMELQSEQRLNEIIAEGEKSPDTPDQKGVKGWLKTKFGSRRQSKSMGTESKDNKKEEKSFVGGAAMTDAGSSSAARSPSDAHAKPVADEAAIATSSTAHEHAVVDDTVGEERVGRSKRRASSVSSVSALSHHSLQPTQTRSDNDDFEEARDHFDEDLAPPPTFAATSNKSDSPVRDSKFHEIIN